MSVMDASILAVAAPSLRADLHPSGAELQMVVVAYTLAFGVLVITGARLGDILGRRRAFLLGLSAFTLASLAAGAAPTVQALIAARICQGVGAALMSPQVLSIIQVQFDGERRARAISAYSVILAVGVAAGQLLGGALLSARLLAAAWRPALLINVPVGITVLVAARWILPAMPPSKRQQLDLRGVGLLCAALLAVVIPLSFGREQGWPAWIWPSLATGLLATSTFVWHERRMIERARTPLLDLGLLRAPGVGAGVAAVLAIMGCYGGFLLSFTLFLQAGLGFSPLQAGSIFAVYASGFALASLSWTRVRATRRTRMPIQGTLCMAAAIATIGVACDVAGWTPFVVLPFLFVAGIGHALGFSPLANSLTTRVLPQRTSDFSGVLLSAATIGNVLGVAAFSGIYLSATHSGGASALEPACLAIAGTLTLGSMCARAATRPGGASIRIRTLALPGLERHVLKACATNRQQDKRTEV